MRTSLLNFLVAISLIFGSCSKDGSSDSSATTTTNRISATYTNVTYASTSTAQAMDIYMPSGTGPFPLVVVIHGGAFLGGDKSGESANCATLTAQGYVAVTINYRLSGEAKFPAKIQDCKAAVRFLRANATKYKIIPIRLAHGAGQPVEISLPCWEHLPA